MSDVTEPAPRARTLLVPFTSIVAAIYLVFTALAMEVYLLLPIAALLFAIGIAPAARLLKSR
jgi:hypothetical protein